MFDSHDFLSYWVHSRGQYNLTGYTNDKLDELIEQAGQEMVTYIRDAILEEVWRIVMDEIIFIPLFYPITVSAMHKSLEMPADPRLIPRFWQGRFK